MHASTRRHTSSDAFRPKQRSGAISRARRLMFLAGILVLLLSVTAPAEASYRRRAGRSDAACTSITLIAHRGMTSRSATENTMRSFANAYRHGARTVETDIRLTADHHWVIMHDATIDRTTNGSGRVLKRTVAQLKTYATDDGVVGGIPTVGQLVRFMEARPALHAQLEIKSLRAPDARVQALVDLLRSSNLESRVQITSFGAAPLKRLRRLDPTLSAGILTERHLTPARVRALGQRVLLDEAHLSRAYVTMMHRHRLAVDTWTVDYRSQWAHAVRARVDSIVTDVVPVLAGYCKS